MAQKLFVNQTAYTLNCQISVRLGSTPGQELTTVNFALNPNSQQMVPYGDPNDPYIDQLEVNAVTNGAVVLSQQIVIARSSDLDNQFNMNDTVYLNLQGQSFVVTTANTWTT